MPKRIITKEELLKLRSGLSKKLVVAGGYYDLLHVSHLSFLERAKRENEILCVFLNSDTNAKRWKGPTRPVINENDRARLLTALRVVDYVVIVDEGIRFDLNYLSKLQPDALAIGDYQDRKTGKHDEHLYELSKALPTMEIRKLPPGDDGPSTSAIIEHIRNLPSEEKEHRDTSWY